MIESPQYGWMADGMQRPAKPCTPVRFRLASRFCPGGGIVDTRDLKSLKQSSGSNLGTNVKILE